MGQSALPFVKTQAYAFHSGITAMGVTQTKHGITTREVLVSTLNQIHAIPRRLLDARRPMKTASAMTADEREELLIPYAPMLDENVKEVITHRLEVCIQYAR